MTNNQTQTISSKTVGPIIRKHVLQHISDNHQPEDVDQSVVQAVAHIATAILLLDEAGIEMNDGFIAAAQTMADKFSEWADTVVVGPLS